MPCWLQPLACLTWPAAIAVVVVRPELPQRLWHACSIKMSSTVESAFQGLLFGVGLKLLLCHVVPACCLRGVVKLRSAMPLAQPDNACMYKTWGSQTSDADELGHGCCPASWCLFYMRALEMVLPWRGCVRCVCWPGILLQPGLNCRSPAYWLSYQPILRPQALAWSILLTDVCACRLLCLDMSSGFWSLSCTRSLFLAKHDEVLSSAPP